MQYAFSFKKPIFFSLSLAFLVVLGYFYLTLYRAENIDLPEKKDHRKDLYFSAKGVQKKLYSNQSLACTITSDSSLMLLDNTLEEIHIKPCLEIAGEMEVVFEAEKGSINYADKRFSADLVLFSGKKKDHIFEGSASSMELYFNEKVDQIQEIKGYGSLYFFFSQEEKSIEITSQGHCILDVPSQTLFIFSEEKPIECIREGLYIYCKQMHITLDTCYFIGEVAMLYAPIHKDMPLQMGFSDTLEITFKDNTCVASSVPSSRVLFVDEKSNIKLSANKMIFSFDESLEAQGEGCVRFTLEEKEWERIKKQKARCK
jgi:hypothetical protein